ncbi:MAG: glutamine--fructose-6-phosphate transaminase (isomerizing) [Bacilli bacterium]|nr:glutamine--fructose-6-phosphate transaminase (isomerizing) [Bacilli bacterium]
MCGILGYVGSRNKGVEFVLNGLEHLEYRGYDSAGIAFVQNSKLNIVKKIGRIANLKKGVDGKYESSLAIGHTRWATHGSVNKNNAHPHHVGKITIVHNGIIENYETLKKELVKDGYIFNSETDSEVACALLDYLYKKNNNINKSIEEFEERVKGAYALGIIVDGDNKLYAVKKSSPLIIGLGENENFIASDVPAIVDYTNKYIILEDGDFACIDDKDILIYSSKNEKVSRKTRIFEGDALSVSKCGYDHFMQKEIYEEPEVIKKTADVVIPDLSKYKRICIVACGSAMHAGLVGKNLIEKYGNIPVDVEIASEFRYKRLFLDVKTLVIAISQSGETADTLEAVKIAKRMGAYTLGIINVKESSIARETDDVVYTSAGSEIAVATTKAYCAQVEILSKIAYTLALKGNKLKEIDSYLDDLKSLPVIMQEVLNDDKTYKKIARGIYKHKDIFFIGRGVDYALAMEGSLKLKEISYLHSEAYAAGELKHGTISLVEKDTPVVGIASDEVIADKTISNLKEVVSRGANVLYITSEGLDCTGDFYNMKIVLPKVNPLLQPLIDIIPLQLIAYYVAKYNKCDIDKPRNLAKSVTVE